MGRKSSKYPENHGNFYTERERKSIVALYNLGMPIKEIAQGYQRTEYAIACQLMKAGVMLPLLDKNIIILRGKNYTQMLLDAKAIVRAKVDLMARLAK